MFIARQPIFDSELNVYGYELLFRLSSESTHFGGISSQGATASIIIGLYESGLENIVEDKFAFINFDERFIHSEALELIKPDQMIVEMLERIKIDASLIERLEIIKEKGYKIALDDFDECFETYPLMPLADIIKYDLLATPLETIADDVRMALAKGKVLLAEKVETHDEFIQARKMGFQLFQGYFFSKPSIAGRSCNKTPTKQQYFRLITELKKEDPSYETLAELIQLDVTLSYRVIRMASVRSNKDLVSSIKYGLIYMGLNEVERWLNILMLQDLGNDKPSELMKLSIVRSRFAEILSKRAEMNINLQHAASMMGLFSTLDGILDQSMEEALEGITLPQSISDALIHHEGALYPIYELMIAYEKGYWMVTDLKAESLNIESNRLYYDYCNAIQWANEVVTRIS
jgi:EAL and modified HD-GYP domain-containing signal transduction protein